MFAMFFFSCRGHLRYLASFPTRRSSDLDGVCVAVAGGFGVALRWGTARLREPVGTPASAADRASPETDRKSTRLNSSHTVNSYAVFCLKKKNNSDSPCGRVTRGRAATLA